MADSQRGDYPPTQQAQQFFKEVTQELNKQISTLSSLVQKQTKIINEKVDTDEIKMITSE